jgi:probable rRNA maturation factor
MAVFIEINDPFSALLDQQLIQQTVELVLRSENISDAVGLSVVISDDNQLHNLNRQFRGIDAPTDVLSFPADQLDPESGERYLGDVIISYPRAKSNCTLEHQDIEPTTQRVQEEVLLLVVHGVLHLLGYDHHTENEKAVMWAKQADILRQLGISPSVYEQL